MKQVLLTISLTFFILFFNFTLLMTLYTALVFTAVYHSTKLFVTWVTNP